MSSLISIIFEYVVKLNILNTNFLYMHLSLHKLTAMISDMFVKNYLLFIYANEGETSLW